MIIIGPEARAPIALGDIASPVPVGPMTIDDMFGEIIAGMAAAVGAEEVAGESAAPTIGEEPPAATPDASAAAAVVQLLTLTVKQQAKALSDSGTDDAQPEAEGEGETPIGAEADVVPGAAPTAPQVVQIPTQPAAPAPQPELVAGKPPKPLKPSVVIEGEVLPQPEAKSPVALAIAEIMQATRQLGLPQARRTAGEPAGRGGDPAPFGQEVKQVVQQAIASLHVQPAAAALELAQPFETLLEPVAAEPRLDPTDFAIEQQLDLSAEGEWLDSLAKDIARTAGEGGTLRFKLNPENLGTLRVEITPHASGAAVRLIADSDAARTLIADAQPRLVAEAKANGVRIAETHVDLGQQNASGDPRRQNAHFEETPLRTARFLRDQEESDGKPTRNQSERYA